MSARKVWWSGAWVDVTTGGGGGVTFPTAFLADGRSSLSEWAAVTCTGSATPFSPGAWVEIDASLSADAGAVTVTVDAPVGLSNTDTSTLLQIGTGTGGAETPWATVLVSQLASVSTASPPVLIVPGTIAAGTRVACRVLSAAQASKQVTARYAFHAATGLGAPVSYGANAANARGVTITYAGSVDTMTAWSEITASTSADIDVLAAFASTAGDVALAGSDHRIEIGVGGAGSEVPLFSFGMRPTSSELLFYTTPNTFAVTVPAGSRLAARYSTDNAATGTVDIVLIGA